MERGNPAHLRVSASTSKGGLSCSIRQKEVTGANVLVAIFSEQESQAVYVLKKQNIARIDVVNFISHGISKVQGNNEGRPITSNESQEEGDEAHSNNPLDAYATNLNEQAKIGRIDPLIGREKEVERVVQILSRRRKNNPLLVGEAGGENGHC